MITINTRNLVEAIREADVFTLPNMNEGTEYLYNTVYNRLARNIDVRLSELDFDSFEPEDVDSLSDLYSDVFESNHYTACRLVSTLRSAAPAIKAVTYV